MGLIEARSAAHRLRVDGVEVAAAEIASSRSQRRRGLLGLDGFEGALWFPSTSSVHTLGMRFSIDVAFCRGDGQVLATSQMPPGRLSRPRLGVGVVVEAAAGSFERWGLEPGRQVSVVAAGS